MWYFEAVLFNLLYVRRVSGEFWPNEERCSDGMDQMPNGEKSCKRLLFCQSMSNLFILTKAERTICKMVKHLWNCLVTLRYDGPLELIWPLLGLQIILGSEYELMFLFTDFRMASTWIRPRILVWKRK